MCFYYLFYRINFWTEPNWWGGITKCLLLLDKLMRAAEDIGVFKPTIYSRKVVRLMEGDFERSALFLLLKAP